MPEDTAAERRLERVREIFRELEAEPNTYDPELARIYAGQWVVIFRGKVIAHGKTATELVQDGKTQQYLGSYLHYVPTLEQQQGVWILPMAASEV